MVEAAAEAAAAAHNREANPRRLDPRSLAHPQMLPSALASVVHHPVTSPLGVPHNEGGKMWDLASAELSPCPVRISAIQRILASTCRWQCVNRAWLTIYIPAA